MRRTLCLSVSLSLLLILIGSSGCYHPRYPIGPPPPAYACDAYGWDAYAPYGGYSECIDDGRRLSFRDRRQLRRSYRRSGQGWSGQTINGMPVMAAYIVPMQSGGEWGAGCGCDPCGGCMSAYGCDGCMSYGEGFACDQTCAPGPCGDCCGMPFLSCDQMLGCPVGGYDPTYDSGSSTPTPVEPGSGTEVPEGDWERGAPLTPQSYPLQPQTFIAPAASRPIEQNWLPAGL